MTHTVISRHLLERVEGCIRKAALANDVEHAGFAGTIREIVLRDLIVPLLPEGFKAATGKIIDRRGQLSSQTDIIIYNKSRFSPLMFDEQSGIFPMDSVFYSIEVKSTISAPEIRDAIKKGKVLRSLDGPHVHHVLFGFKTDVSTAESDLQRFHNGQSASECPFVNIYCTVGSGYTYWKQPNIWNVFTGMESPNEVIGLLIGIVNTLVNDGITRPAAVDPGHYLSPWNNMATVVNVGAT